MNRTPSRPPGRRPAQGGTSGAARPSAPAAAPPKVPHSTQETGRLGPGDIDTLQRLLDGLPAPGEPLDVVMLDGFLCALLLQPRPVPLAQWWPWVLDSEGQARPKTDGPPGLQALVLRRHAELEQAIAGRQWFDPWVFEHEPDADPSEPVMPWVAGFSLALNELPPLPELDEPAAQEPLALLYRHLDPDDLEDAEELLAQIDEMEPPADLAEAVEDLVRATLLLADLTRPIPGPRGAMPPRSGPPSLGARRRRT